MKNLSRPSPKGSASPNPLSRDAKRSVLLLVLISLTLVPPLARADEAGKLILDEGAYWRYLVCFGPDSLDAAALKAEGEKLLDAEARKRLEGKVKRYWQPPFVTADEARNFDDADWRDHARIWFPVGQGDSERAALNVRSEPPPAGWMAPDFDAAEAGWPRQRMPLMVGNVLRPANMHGDKDMQQLGVRAAYFRTTFEVADPAAGEYSLSLAFRGGGRVFVNGREIARKHLPPGELPADAHADVYPADAYLCHKDEVPEKLWDGEARKIGVVFCEDLPGKFDDAFSDGVPREGRTYWNSVGRSSFSGYFGGWTQITRAGFDRVTALRNRTIGPLKIPADALRKGTNVLAIEVRASLIHPAAISDRAMEWGRAFQREMYWSHCRLLEVGLRGTDPKAVSALSRPAGVQVWAEDIHHRCWTGDFGPSGGGAPTVRVVGAANGTCSGQLVVGADRELKGLSVAASALKSADGKSEIPAPAVRVGTMVAHPATELVKLGQIRNAVEDRSDPLCPPAEMAVFRLGPPEARSKRLPREARLAMLTDLKFFDHIANPHLPVGAIEVPAIKAEGVNSPPRERGVDVPPDTCQPAWVWVSIPAGAAPGAYEGTLTVKAEGMDPTTAVLKVEVIDWRVPGPSEFQTIVALEQSPYGVAKHYGVKPWSDEHFKLLEESFRELARVGNDVVFVPCLQNTEFGNFEDTIIRWTRKKDGSLAFDYANLDRYLALARKYLGTPRTICFVVVHGADRFGPGSRLESTVSVFDERNVPTGATGKSAPLDLSTNAEGYREPWKAFAPDLYNHMTALGLAGSMRWGFVWDNEGDPILPALLGELVPEVTWARSGHQGHPDGRFTFACSSLGFGFTESSQMGWKGPVPDLLCPRSGSSTLSSNGHSPPFTFRLVCDRAIVAGANGVGRLGADYFADIFFRGYAGSLSGGIAGMPCSTLLWPGAAGAEPSARFEALREGVQEAEARIYLEQALDRKLIDGELAGRVRDVLFRHNRETLYVSPGRVGVQVHEYAAGWQQRSRRLLAAAAEVAKALPMDVDATALGGKVPARASVPVNLTVRNWTSRPREFTASSDQPWIVVGNPSDNPRLPADANPRLPAGAIQNTTQASTEDANSPLRKQGVSVGHQALRAVIDTHKLAPGASAEGKITVTDTAAGRSFVVPVKANVGPVMDLVMPAWDMLGSPGHAAAFDPKRVADYATFNVPVGGSESDEFALVNASGSDLSWKIAPSADWLAVAPAGGKLARGERAFVKVTAAPKETAATKLEAALKVTTADGSAEVTRRIVCHVIPAYVAPTLPGGAATDLKDLPKDRIVGHKSVAYWVGSSAKDRPDYGPVFGPRGDVDHTAGVAATTMIAGVEQETVYRIEGLGAAAFSATVAIPKAYAQGSLSGTQKARASFEVYADGKLVAQSGLMTPGDEPRLIVAGGLDGVKELRFVTRFDRPDAERLRHRMYVHWIGPKLHGKP